MPIPINDHYYDILRLIKIIRESFIGSEIVYTEGSCVRFAMILKFLLPKGTILYSDDHTIFEYEGHCYDINGHASKTKHHRPIEEIGIMKAYEVMSHRYKMNGLD